MRWRALRIPHEHTLSSFLLSICRIVRFEDWGRHDFRFSVIASKQNKRLTGLFRQQIQNRCWENNNGQFVHINHGGSLNFVLKLIFSLVESVCYQTFWKPLKFFIIAIAVGVNLMMCAITLVCPMFLRETPYGRVVFDNFNAGFVPEINRCRKCSSHQ